MAETKTADAPAAEMKPDQPPSPPDEPDETALDQGEPGISWHRVGPQVVVSGHGFGPGEALRVILEVDYQDRGMTVTANAKGDFTVYSRADPQERVTLSVRRASGALIDEQPNGVALADDDA